MRLALAFAALFLATAAEAAPQVRAAWSRPAAAGGTGAGFMTLANPDARADTLVAVASPAARKVEIHRSQMKGGIASMQPVSAVPLPARGSVTFAPGGYHLMFVGLARTLKAGDRVPATLSFASGAKVQATFVVGLSPPADEHRHH